MKKSFLIFLSILLVLGFSASAFALHASSETAYNPGAVTKEGVQIQMSGEILAEGELTNNLDFNSDNADYASGYETRVRLKTSARVTPQTMGVVELETAMGTYGDAYGWGSASMATGGYTNGNAKRGDLQIRQAFIAHQGSGLLGRTAGIKVGHMLVRLGNGLFFNHTRDGDDAIVLWTTLNGGEVSLNYLKLNEGMLTQSDDANAYVFTLEYPLDMANISADVTYLDDQAISDGLHFWNFGVRGDTKAGDIGLNADVEFQIGKQQGPDIDFKGWAFLVGADYHIGDITVDAEVAYGSGDDDPMDDDMEAFVTTLGVDEQHYTLVYEDRAVSAAGATSTGLTNTWYIKVGAATTPAPDLKLGCDAYYLQASEDVSLGGGEADTNLGWEVDGRLEYQVDRNLVYYVDGGYLVAGDAYDPAGDSADNAYVIRNGLNLKF